MRDYIDELIERLRDAGWGIWHLYLDSNFRLHLKCCIPVVILALAYRITDTTNLGFLAIAVGLVLIAEGFNTVVECFCDWTLHQVKEPDESHYDEIIGVIKRMSAGTVLIAAILAVVLGTIVFAPHFGHTFNQLTAI